MNTLADTPILILCGGLGTRLKAVVSDRPKGLAPIGDTPFLRIQIELLKRQGAKRFVLLVGHGADQIRDEFGTEVSYSVEPEGKLMGTAGAVRLAAEFATPRAFVMNGDTYLDVNYADVLARHLQSGAKGTLSVSRLDDASRFGTVTLDTNEECVTGFREKQATPPGEGGWLNAGVYVLERELIDAIPADRPVSIERETFPQLLAAGEPLAAFKCRAPFYDIGTPDDFRRFQGVYREFNTGHG